MKAFAVSVALGAILTSPAAFAANQRPAYIAFSNSAAAPAPVAAPATPSVANRKSLQPGVVLPVVLGVGAAGIGLALLIKDDKDSSPE